MTDDPVARFGGAANVPSVPPGSARADEPSPSAESPRARYGEILSPQQLRDCARELARAHARVSRKEPIRPLLAEIEQAGRELAEAYRAMRTAAEAGRDLVPAEEWLVDNFHVVEDQIREIREDLPPGYYAELPRLSAGRQAGYPRVYAAALEFVERTDALFDRDSLLSFVRAYQEIDPLSIGELWAVPIMLRVGLLLNLRRLAHQELEQRALRERADRWAERLADRARQRPADMVVGVAELATSGEELSPVFLVRLVKRLRDQEVPLGAALEWVDQILAETGTTAADLARQQQHRQAADQVSVGNSITAMRQIAALSWVEFFERASLVEEILSADPARAYAAMEPTSRDDYRRRVERLAGRSGASEIAAAQAAVALARAGAEVGGAQSRRAHVGYYLVGEGRQALEAEVGYRPPPAERIRRLLRVCPAFTYLGTIGFLEVVILLGLVAVAGPLDPLRACLLVLLLVLPCSEIAVSLVNWATTFDLKPRLLPKLDFREGLPATHRTMVVVPTLLSDVALENLLADLEVRYLANQDPHLHFALLTDLPDAEVEARPGEDQLVRAAADGIAALNARYGRGQADRFYLFHRHRLWNPSQGVWMGWERKRGKLEEFNRLLRGATDTSFSVQIGDSEVLPEIRYVITLDSDTQLPRDVARRLVGIIAHPLQRAELDPELGCVRHGYAIIQPRASSTLLSAGRSLFARIFTGNTGLDPYTTAVSDVYQDLFGEASYYGKGIYDVDAFSASLGGRVPENHLLSHDLFESLFARTGLASDVELLDDFPAHYSVHAGRQHRWVRGDWQQAVWLLPWVPLAGGGQARNRLPLLARWKLLDNLRRSLLPLSLVALLVAGWTVLPGSPLLWTAIALLALATPIFVHLTSALLRPDPGWSSSSWSGWRDLRTSLLQAGVALALLADQASLMGDAIARTLYRLWFSRRNLLQWEAAAEAERRVAHGLGPLWRRMWPASALSIAILALVATTRPAALPIAAPFVLLWFLSPAIAHRISQPIPLRERQVPPASTALLRLTARKTWRFFETFVTAEDNWLPPDNYQEDPRGVLARRTSPTNIGLYLLSVLAARDFHYIGLRELVNQVEATLDTLERLEKSHGHLYNWYDTATLEVLQPAYISTVDSGNLAGHLLVLKHGCLEMLDRPLVDERFLLALDDILALLAQAVDEAGETRGQSASRVAAELRRRVAQARGALPADPAGWAALLSELGERAGPLAEAVPAASEQGGERIVDFCYWTERLVALIDTTRAELAELESRERLDALWGRLRRVAERAEALALAMDFRLLYDADRQLFAIGYNLTLGRRDNSYYDLLASEARLASLMAIAKGDVPQAHWFRLGRGLAAADGHRALLSWSGTMFEYLMPLLAMRSYPRTLLDETADAVVQRQIEYGAARGIPWGISESAYNTLDLALNYQYQAFGVPGLGMKPGLAENLVVSPYSAALALMVRPRDAAQNLERLAQTGLDGRFGFYEAVDYTPRRVPPGRRSVVVRAFMAHHQGMILVALDNVLHGDPMPRRFHAEPLVRATELLLQERIPDVSWVIPLAVAEDGAAGPRLSEVDLGQTARVVRLDDPAPAAHLLANGAYSVMLTPSGGGYSLYRGRMLTRWRGDGTLDERGTFVYLRDLTSGRIWSSGYQPTRAEPDDYQAVFQPEGVQYRRRDGDVETLTEVVVSPERNAEVRRVTLINHGDVVREVELTSYAEVVLAPGAADVAHPAFGGLFVETEALPEHGGAVLCSRRPRSADEARLWLIHISATRAEAGPSDFETSRFAFVGRNQTPAAPAALSQPALSRTTGAVLDPIVSLRRVVRLAPDERAQVSFSTAAAESREEALTLADQLSDPRVVDRTFELAWTDARVELRHLNISADQMHRYLQLAWALLYGDRALRAPPDLLARNTRAQSGLWAYGISGDLPILLVRVDDSSDLSLIDELLRAHEYWRLSALTVDLVILNEDPGGYLQPLQEQLLALVGASPAHGHLGQHGGVFVHRADLMSEQDQVLLHSVAAVVLTTGQGSLSRQLGRRGARRADLPRPRSATPSARRAAAAPVAPADGALLFYNGRGGFSPDGREYVIELGPDESTPVPWCNVLANEHFGALVSESGLGYTWHGNSQTHRLTPWSNDPVVDPAGEAVYLRDDADGAIWSPTPLPSRDDQPYTVRHGQGYTMYQHTSREIGQELTVSVAHDAPIKLLRLRLRNDAARPRQLTATAFVEWVLGPTRERTADHVVTEYVEPLGAVLATCPYVEPGSQVAFLAASERPTSYTADRTEFLGRFGSRDRPAALDRSRLIGTVGAGYDPCAALQVTLALEPGDEREVVWLLGRASNREQAAELIGRYADPARAEQALQEVVTHWDSLLGTVEVATPDRALDVLVNRWLPYQTLACRFWARSAFYQSGGAYGFRDQLQDAMAVLYAAPAQARAHMLRSAARQFVEGDVQHWWHPDTGQGVRTRCSDDLLWLPYVVARYVERTGDHAVLDERVPFLEDRPLEPDEQERFGVPAASAQAASLYDHCLRALERGQTRGPHGLPLIGNGDWNDGLNRVGHLGRGESIWVGWFLAATLNEFAPLCQARGDAARAAAFRAEATRLGAAIDEQAWDGEWYRRAYFDDGTPLGSATNDACAIDAIAQSWAVISGVGRSDRALQAMEALHERLIRSDLGMILLMAPPFQETGLDPGYIKGYLPGVRENGGQYTHGALWAVQATAMLGDGDRAAELFGWLNPINRSLGPEAVERYKVEPYVVAADVYASAQHLGRGGWTWYTGSAGWMYRLAIETLLGFRLRGDHFTLDPVIPRAWSGFKLRYRAGSTHYEITVENPDGVSHGVRSSELDGHPLAGNTVPLVDDGQEHRLRVVIGRLTG